jgi:hypothetical protein
MAKGEIGRFFRFFEKRKGLDDRKTGDKTLLGDRGYAPSERAPIGRRQLIKSRLPGIINVALLFAAGSRV